MKYLKSHMIFESLEKQIKLSDEILTRLIQQNPIIDDVETILLELSDSWGFEVHPWYELDEVDSRIGIELRTQKSLDYFGMGEGDFDNPQEDYKSMIEFMNDVRVGKRKDLKLKIKYQYANENNGFKPLKESDKQKEVFNEVRERLESMGCEVETDYSPESSSLGPGLWETTISVPVKFQTDSTLSEIDGFSKKFIKDFNQFIKDYKIDTTGQTKLSDLIRSIK